MLSLFKFKWLKFGDNHDAPPNTPASNYPPNSPSPPSLTGSSLTSSPYASPPQDDTPRESELPSLVPSPSPTLHSLVEAIPLLQPAPRYYRHSGCRASPKRLLGRKDPQSIPAEESDRPTPPMARVYRWTSTGPRPLERHLNCSTYRRLASRMLYWDLPPHKEDGEAEPADHHSICLWPTFGIEPAELKAFLSVAVGEVASINIRSQYLTISFEKMTGAGAVWILKELFVLVGP
ncbi:hypothetical protein CC85DRAFT_327105 [Cutaneotrichosporon oleaginosum]|uniref:Uncharacterized protein n=1 Tax=Cutaneotrichosporon oleaginosum TaxID=879819 RepID=A0A0J0XRJ9_9TREE|nr:uncharacterized protein CC85DRAFT_327105 [Cutaneotrichosporon oleaginosum]KLT43756.1 hypothetical protein CC85DRAFT_327105 [Cutaneotrichosporon oleaginosum]TXT05173.1 hypothetical protein COLE_06493 [Cutaneotrichosporon oleaginosum]